MGRLAVIRVFIADDHEIIREGVRRLLDQQPDLACCGEATGLDEALAALSDSPADIVVLDINMPGGGPGAVQRLRALAKPPRVVVFTFYPEDSHALAFLRAGAGAFVSKASPMVELVNAIRSVHAYGKYRSPHLATFMAQQRLEGRTAPSDLLSDRELDVIRRLATGRRATEIATDLSVSPSTVNTYVRRIKDKLGVRTTVQIVEFVLMNGLLG